MKMATLIPLLFLLSCKDVDTVEFNQRDAGQINGLWRGVQHPNWEYWFVLSKSAQGQTSGMLIQQVVDFGTSLVRHEYACRTSKDTIFLQLTGTTENTPLGSKRRVLVEFENDTLATLTELSSGLNPTLKIKRLQ